MKCLGKKFTGLWIVVFSCTRPCRVWGVTSRAFRGAKERYPPMEKLAFALIYATRKLQPYFQAHTIVLLTNHPLWKAMNRPNTTGRLIQWSIELSKFDIDYRSRTEIKAQALADFIVEFTTKDDEPKEDEKQTS